MNRARYQSGRSLLVIIVLLLLLALALRFQAAAPATAIEVTDDIPMSVQEERDAEEESRFFSVRKEALDDGSRYWLRNLLAGPIQVHVDWVQHENMRADPTLPHRRVIPPRSEVALTTLTHVDRSRPAGFKLEYSAIAGSPSARHSAAARYRVPVGDGKRWRLGQGFNGRFSHQSPVSRYALDFEIPVGTPVVAARAGIVMQIQDDYRGSGQHLEHFASRANFVRILHDDGSMAMYAHLEYYGVGVKVGQRVAAGDLLGLSGNTGYSTGPHLHFAVLVNNGRDEESVPFDMDDVDEDSPGD